MDMHYISLIYSKLESLNNRKCLSNNNCFKKSINEFIIWHQKLEMRMFPNNKYPNDIPIRQVTKALLFTSVVGREHMADLNFMSTLFSGNEFKPILPVLIFSYICNYTESDYKKLHNIIDKKSKVDPFEFIKDTLLQKKTPHYLNITESSCKSMNEQYSERLIKNIKYGFIHIVSFLKILNLPICKESEKLRCLNWYMDTFSENAHTFFSLDEFNRIKATLGEYGQNKIKHMNDADYLERVQFIDRIIDNIEKIDDFDMTKKYVNKIQKYISEKKSIKIEKTIEERNMNFFLVPVSFTQRYDYYYGKFLYKLMYKSERQCDLLNIFIDTNKLHAKNLFVYCKSSDKEPAFSLYDVDFSLTSVNMMKEKEKLELYKPWYAFPFFLIEYNNTRESNESKFKGYEWDRENDYYLEGSISNIHGALKLGENKITCSVPNISCEDAFYIIINGFMYKQQDFREYIDIRKKSSKNWVGHVLVFYIVYGGMCEPLANLTKYAFSQVSNTKKQIRNQIDVSIVESDE